MFSLCEHRPFRFFRFPDFLRRSARSDFVSGALKVAGIQMRESILKLRAGFLLLDKRPEAD